MAKQLTIIPFSGFYESLHDSEIDHCIEQMFSDRDTGCTRNENLEMHLFNTCDFSAVHRDYAKAYAEAFGREFKIASLEFESLQSPREYNFTTDRIFVHIDGDEVKRIRDATNEKELRDKAREMFTSRDGFISFYSPDIDDWGDVSEWDHNQLSCLLQAYAECESNGGGFDQYAEYSLMGDAFSNGHLNNMIETATPNIQRLYRIYNYLEQRKER